MIHRRAIFASCIYADNYIDAMYGIDSLVPYGNPHLIAHPAGSVSSVIYGSIFV